MVLMKKTLPLLVPVQLPDGDMLKEIVVPRLKAIHLRRLGGSPTLGDIIDIIPDLCAIPPKVVDELDGADTMALAEIIGDFLDRGQPADGKTQST